MLIEHLREAGASLLGELAKPAASDHPVEETEGSTSCPAVPGKHLQALSLSLLSELHTASYSISPHFQGKPQLPPTEPREKPAGSIDSYLKSANSWLAEKKDIAERLLKNTENMKGFFGGLETKLKGPLVRKNE